MGASFGTLEIRNQFFIRTSLSLGTAGMKIVTNGRMFLAVFVLFLKLNFAIRKLPLPVFYQLARVGSLVQGSDIIVFRVKSQSNVTT